MARRNVVCICGSGRFWTEICRVAQELTRNGHVVLRPEIAAGGQAVIDPAEKAKLDALHLDKIDMADEVFVVNCDGQLGPGSTQAAYVGESTGKEIRHALTTGKRVTFLDPETGRAWVKENVVEKEGEKPTLASPEVVAMRQAAAKQHHERTQLLEHAADLLDHLETAWGVIANANGGDWGTLAQDWRKAAERWRDRWHEILNSPVMDKTKGIRAMRSLQMRLDRIVTSLREQGSGPTVMREVTGELDAIKDLLTQAWSVAEDPRA